MGVLQRLLHLFCAADLWGMGGIISIFSWGSESSGI